MENVMVSKRDILKYSYYDESGKYIATLNEEYLKELFGVDRVELKEDYKLLN